MSAGFTIEAPSMSDAAALSALAQASFCNAFADRHYPPRDLAQFLDEAMGAARYATEMANPDYALRIARDAAGAIIGFIKMGPNELPMPAGEPSASTTRELHQLYLAERAKGSGIADALMAWGLDEARARGAAVLYLSVFVENHRAKAFYARHGFAEIGQNPFRVGSVIDDDRVWKRML
ncbi:MAG: GNAT family N-acetyltransferase [Sphingopyxis sp.]